MPRLLAVSWTPLWPPAGGAAIRGMALLSRLPGFDVAVAAPGPLPPGWPGIATPSLARSTRPFDTALRGLDFNPDILNAFSPALAAAAWRLARSARPDLVLTFGVWAMPAALAAARGAPVVLDLAHVETATARETRPGDPRLGLLRRFETWAVRRATRVFTVSDGDRERVAELVPGARPRIRTVANGVERPEPLPLAASGAAPPAEPPMARALFAGRMSFRPNRAAAEFLAREVAPLWPSGRIVIAGSSPPAGLDGVEVVASPESMAPLYARARLACAPVFAGSGVRTKVLEAARYGVPLVATERAVDGYGYRPDEHYLRAETAPEFAAAFQALAAGEGPGRRLVENARERIATAGLLWDDSAAVARLELTRLAAAGR